MLKIIVDAMGGDNAPAAVIEGCAAALRDFDIEVILVGKRGDIERETGKYPDVKFSIVNAPDVISGEDKPMDAVREKKNSSMMVGLSMLSKGEGDAFVSAGNTGALIAGSTLTVKRIHGVRRVALAPIMPSEKGAFILVDAGANAECTSQFLSQFAVMGDIYMKKVMDIECPRVGLVNIGEEDGKGRPEVSEANEILKNSVGMNYIGNVEARDIPQGVADVVVCDGFTGNVLLKLTEGMGIIFGRMLKNVFKKNAISYMAAAMVKGGIDDIKKTMDYTEYGGAPLLGVSRSVIKAHGSSNAKAFYHALRQAVKTVENDVVGAIKENIEKYEVNEYV